MDVTDASAAAMITNQPLDVHDYLSRSNDTSGLARPSLSRPRGLVGPSSGAVRSRARHPVPKDNIAHVDGETTPLRPACGRGKHGLAVAFHVLINQMPA
jgi:hypothetical protein